jgi:hypothetical protein
MQRAMQRAAKSVGLLLLVVILSNCLTTRSPIAIAALPTNSSRVTSKRSKRCRRQSGHANASYARFSSALQDEVSNAQQQQKCRDFAAREDKSITSEFEFADEAVSGTLLNRDGLNALLAAAEQGHINTVYFFSLSRLARESVIGMPILKRLVYMCRVRVVSVTEGLDSNREGWETLAQILLMQHERYLKELSANTFRGQEGNVANCFSNGDYCFGYTSVRAPGVQRAGKGRRLKPRMVYQTDPQQAEWVRRIFYWFVVERRSLRWIARELNRLGAPKDHRSSTKIWRHQYLTRLLKNRKYIGIWPWGEAKTFRDPSTGQKFQELRSPEESDKWVRHFPELRLISDEMFAAAQAFLAENEAAHAVCHQEDGKFSHEQKGAAAANPGHLLSGLVVCKQCESTFWVGGANGKYLFCPTYQHGGCSCQTTLRRDLAEELILKEISTRILADPNWFEATLNYLLVAWRRMLATLPSELRDSEVALAEVNRMVSRLVDSIERQDDPDPDVQERLTSRRAERRTLEAKLADLRQKSDQIPSEPTKAWVAEQLRQLREVLSGKTPAAAIALRALVGGRIVVEEVREEGRKRFFLRGSFQIELGQVVSAIGINPVDVVGDGKVIETITIDFVRTNPLDAKADEAKALRDQGLSHKEIALKMNRWPSQITKYLQHWSKIHRQPLPTRPRKVDRQFCKYQLIADEVMRRVNNGELLREIAVALEVDQNTITSAIRFWHESRGLPVPDGRSRRKSLARKVSRPRRPPDTGDGDSAAVA